MIHYNCGASNKIKDLLFRTPAVFKERNDAAHLISSSLPKSWDGPCLYMAWNPRSAWINKVYIGSTTRSFSTRFKEHMNCIMIGDKHHDIPFYQITRQDGSFADMIFSPIVYFENGITLAQCQALEFMTIGWARPKFNFPFAKSRSTWTRPTNDYVIKGVEQTNRQNIRRRQPRSRRCGLPLHIHYHETKRIKSLKSPLCTNNLQNIARQICDRRRKSWKICAVIKFMATRLAFRTSSQF